MVSFSEALSIVLRCEGGYVDNPNDRGGKTKFGISQRSYPNEDIRNLTLERATGIYKRDFWDRMRIEYLPKAIQLFMFDTGVNMGPYHAAVILQRAVCVREDGIIGSATISQAFAYDSLALLNCLRERRLDYYNSLAGNFYFIKGWTSRVEFIYQKSISEERDQIPDASVDR